MRIPDDFVNSRKTNFSSWSQSVVLKCELNQHFSRGIHQFVIFFFCHPEHATVLRCFSLVKASDFPKRLCGRDFKILKAVIIDVTPLGPYKKHRFSAPQHYWLGYGCDCFRSIYTLKGMMWHYIVNTAFYATHWGSSLARLSMGIVFTLVVVDTRRDPDARHEGAVGKKEQKASIKVQTVEIQTYKMHKYKREVDKRPMKKVKYKNEEVKKWQ